MAIKLVDMKPDGTAYYVADTDADITSLPTDSEEISAGSTCLVIGTGSGGKVLMLNNQEQWTEI